MSDNSQAQDQGKPPAPPAEPPKPPESPPVTPSPSVPPAQPPPPVIDEAQVSKIREEIKKEVSGEVQKSVLERLGEALGITKKQEETLPTDPQQLQKYINKKIDEQFSQISKDADKSEQEEASQRQTRITSIINGWYSQYDQMAKLGKVPDIKNPNDKNDEGVVARRKIIQTIGKIIEGIKSENPNSDYVPSVSEALMRFPNAHKAPPGEDLPISGNTAVRDAGANYKYDEVHNKSFQQIIDEAT